MTWKFCRRNLNQWSIPAVRICRFLTVANNACFHLQVRSLTPGLQKVRRTKLLGTCAWAVACFRGTAPFGFMRWRRFHVFWIICSSGNSLSFFSSSRSEVSSSSSLDSPVQAAQQVSVQVLLHSQCLQTSEQDCEILSSQQDLFEADKTGKCV